MENPSTHELHDWSIILVFKPMMIERRVTLPERGKEMRVYEGVMSQKLVSCKSRLGIL